MVADTLATVRRLRSTNEPERRERCCYGRTPRSTDTPRSAAAIRGGAQVSITVRLDPKVKTAIAAIPDRRMDPHRVHRRPLRREHRQRWISRAEVAEIAFTAFTVPRKPPSRSQAGWWCAASPTSTTAATTLRAPCSTPGASTRSSPPPTSTPSLPTRPTAATPSSSRSTPTSKNSALAHLPSGRLQRQRRLAGAAQSSPSTSPAPRPPSPARRDWPEPRTATIRRTLVTVPARIASSARRLTLHLPRNWPWETAWNTLFNNLSHRNTPIIA